MTDPAPNLYFVKLLRTALVGLMIALVPCVLLAALFAPRFIVWVMGVFVAGLVVVRFAFQLWQCPGCGKPFFRGGAWAGPNMFTKRCMHCGLSEAQDAPPSITGANKAE
jgi:hypothetical protein